MPTRIVREGIISSEPINRLSWGAELFYRRLMSVADDYGRYFSNPALLRAACFPLQIEKVSEKQIGQWLKECIDQSLLFFYGGKYLQIEKFNQQTRSASKFPEPTENELLSKCKSNDTPPLNIRLRDSTTSPTPNTPTVNGENFEKFWAEYPLRVARADAEKAWKKQNCDSVAGVILEAVRAQKRGSGWTKDGGKFIPHPATWLNGRRWLDEVGCVKPRQNMI